MQIQFTGHNVDVTTPLKTFTEEKLQRLTRHFDRITSINVTFDVEKIRKIVEANINVKGAQFHARSESDEDMYAAVDVLIDKLDRQIIKHKEKASSHRD